MSADIPQEALHRKEGDIAGHIDLLCTKRPGVHGFESIIFVGSENGLPLTEDSKSQRQKIVQLLHGEGINVKFQGRGQENIVTYTSEHINEPTLLPNIKVNIHSGGADIGYLNCVLDDPKERRGFIQKYYEYKKAELYREQGLMQIAFSLLVEEIKNDPALSIDAIHGYTEKKNNQSVYSRLYAPNITEGGYFAHRLVSLDDERWNVITHIYERGSIEHIQSLL